MPAPSSKLPQIPTGEAWLVYDGECPACRNFTSHVRLRKSVGEVHLVDAREGGPIVDEIQAAGFDLDKGMAFKIGGRLYHGADCLHVLALLSSDRGWFNRLNAALFRWPLVSRLAYPPLKAGRNLLLFVRGKRPINHPHN
ncbi:MAG TPA: DCC1-like thiol-disulfide oxidoreductase family protein [Caulobacteraceae bacterium]|nr:DCC1-like thiol-disulfide oxidoreductase family protein [Caulobacteraceae bacterium]